MAGFQDIIGHESIIAHLKSAIAMDKVSHAYILSGPDRSGKMMLAKAFAQTLQCQQVEEKKQGLTEEDFSDRARKENSLYDINACGTCRSCKQAINGNQPDIIYVSHEKPNTISVDDVRHQINGDMEIKPYSSRYKIYIVDEAEKMNQQAQNALLKTLEEPPAYGVILLLTTNADMMLQTIRSRCVLLELKAVADEKIKGHLMRNCGVPDYRADLCVSFAQGNVGKAMMLADSEDFREMREYTMQLLRRIGDIPNYEINQELKPLQDRKDAIQDFFDLLLLWYRDVLLYKSSGQTDLLTFRDLQYEIQKQSEQVSFAGLNTIIEAIETAARRIQFNVNYELTLELLMMEIKEKIQ